MKVLFFLSTGFFIGLWVSWPGIFIQKNWKCFNNIISKSKEEKISLKAALAVSPNYFIKKKNNDSFSKLRIVSDACFR